MNNFDTIRSENRLLLEYIRGSHLYNLNIKTSDIDTGGIYICKPEEYLGFIGYKPEVADSKHDNTWYEVGKYIELLTKSNPTVMEALFCPESKRLHWDNRLDELYEYRENLLTKEIFWPFFGYAKSQIAKARGLNKKIVNPITERKTCYDFIYTFKDQGSQPILDWLAERGLKAEYCGLNAIPHMHNIYGVYYDWYADKDVNIKTYTEYGHSTHPEILHYRGILCENVSNTTQLRVSSIPDKAARPICYISFNNSGFQDHCKKYKEYKEWEKNRNPARYESNLEKTYDSKNLCHCFRLIHMCSEILTGKGFNLERTWDRDFLLKIRNHEFEYDELINKLNSEKEKIEREFEASTIHEKVDRERLNQILINIRKSNI